MDCRQESIESKFKILLQMSLIVVWKTRVPVVRVARMAGQFAKPRYASSSKATQPLTLPSSSPTETVNGVELMSFKGDNVNSFDASAREPDPNRYASSAVDETALTGHRLVLAYFHSVATLNYLRAMVAGGVADLHDPKRWDLRNVLSESVRKDYEKVVDRIVDTFNFLNVFHADTADVLKKVDIFTSHEALLLNYEEALTRKGAATEDYFNLGAHFLWIGDRTRQLDGAHVEYFRGIENPIGVKVGPTTKPEELKQLVRILNPKREEGKLTLITRYGAKQIAEHLPVHIAAVNSTGVPVIWCCDPCHGNTETQDGVKTRRFESIVREMCLAFKIHAENGSRLGGVHLELTGEDVTECVGGASGTSDLSTNYSTYCDPRLNYTQSLDIAFSIAREVGNYVTHNKLRKNLSSADLAGLV